MTSMLARAIALTAQAFEHHTDKAGQPYILHCLRVMDTTQGDEERKCIAVMHDLLEDTPMTVGQLENLGFTQRIIRALVLLKHERTDSYDAYIKLLSHNQDCVEVKKADLKDNSNITRLKGLTKKDFDRLENYHRAWVYLSKI